MQASTLEGGREKAQEFKAILGYISILKAASAIRDPAPKQSKQKM